ncbi:MAG: LOG family protein [Rhodospirillales bacterium]|nr:LOG family protein [Rhodospirillales bacterium]MCW9001725.1 LOG family protein [Rhodospirillales bacterium]MCW9039017.1 LOG family protein [Rhodospirillales bacterium]
MDRERYASIRAYTNQAFISSREGRALRILSEYLEPKSRFEKFNIQDTIVFMGSARAPSMDVAEAELAAARAGSGNLKHAERRHRLARWYEDARELSHRLTEWSKQLKGRGRRFVICTGGGPGLMEAANRGAAEAKGINLGFNISIPMEQQDNPYISKNMGFEFHYFFMRKFWFAYLAKAIVFMPGGFGTLDELFEVLTLSQTRKLHKRLPIVLFGSEYWDRVLDMEAMADFGTISPEDLDLVYRTDSVDEAFDFLTRELTEFSLGMPGADL